MGYARYIGRVGALAVALGVGAAVATPPGTAWATPSTDGSTETDGATTSSTPDTTSTPDSIGGAAPAPTGPESAAESGPADPGTDPSQATVTVGDASVSASGGANTTVVGAEPRSSDEDTDENTEGDDADQDGTNTEPPAAAVTPPAFAATNGGSDATAVPPIATPPASGPENAAVSVISGVSESLRQAVTTTLPTATATPDASARVVTAVPTDTGAATTSVSPVPSDDASTTAVVQAVQLMASVFSPFMGPTPNSPTAPAMMWAVLAWARREFDPSAAPVSATPLELGLLTTSQTLDEDAAGASMALMSMAQDFSLMSALPPGGTLELANAGAAGTSAPAGVALSADGSRAYVTNFDTGTVSVIDTATNATLGAPITVGSNPTGAVLNSTGTRLYVANRGSNSVSVIDTANNTVVKTIPVGSGPEHLALSPDGTRLWVSNTGAGTVTKINTATNGITSTGITVGAAPGGIAFSPDGKYAYVANTGSDTVSAIRTTTNAVTTLSGVGDGPTSITVDPGTGVAYVTASDGTVRLLDTATNTVTGQITTGKNATAAALSPDGTILVTANTDDTVTAIDTTTHTVITTLQIDSTPAPGTPTVAFHHAGGAVYVTDRQDNALRKVLLTMATTPNTAPEAGAHVIGTPDPDTGTVAGTVVATDDDLDTLTYTLTDAGGAEVTVDAATGAFTYTPTPGQRLAAAETPGTTGTFIVTVSDGRAPIDVAVSVPISALELGEATTTSTPAGPSPDGLVLSPDGSRAYVTNRTAGTVTVIDTATGATIGSPIAVGNQPTGVALNADGSRLYVANRASNSVTVINTGDNSIVKTITNVGTNPERLAISPDGTRLWVSNAGGGTVSKVNTATNQVVTTGIQVGTNPGGIAFSPDGKFAYVAGTGSDTVTAINTATNARTTITGVGDNPTGVTVNPATGRAYVTTLDGKVTVLNTTTNTVIGTITTGKNSTAAALSPDGNILVTANTDDTITTIDAITGTVITTVSIDDAPEPGNPAIAYHPSGQTIFITDGPDNVLRSVSYQLANNPPEANDDTATVDEGATTTIFVLDNDVDVDGYHTIDPATLVVTQPANGSASVDPVTGVVTYSSNGADVTSDSFTYIVKDTSGAISNTATVNITVTPVNDPPTALDQAASTDEDTPAAITVVTAGTDPDTPTGDLTVTTNATAGTATYENSTGVLTYTPNADHLAAGETQIDTFSYTISDGQSTSTAEVTVTITGVNDPPNPVDVEFDISEDEHYVIGVGIYGDPDTPADQLSVSSNITAEQGNIGYIGGQIIYTPNGQRLAVGETRVDEFDITVDDGQGGIATSTVRVTVIGANDDPTGPAVLSFEADEDTLTSGNLLTSVEDYDDSDVHTVSVVDSGTHGSLEVNSETGEFTYTPFNLAVDDTVTDTFTYIVSDGNGGTFEGTLQITTTGLNDTPVANPDTYSVDENDVLDTADAGMSGVLFNDSDIDAGDSLTAVGETKPTAAGGSVTINADGSFVYTPPGVHSGIDSFTYTVSDGTDTATGTVSLTINEVNEGPSITSLTASLPQSSNGAVTYTLTVTDPDTPPANLDIDITAPANGTVSQPVSSTPGTYTFTYTPNPLARLAAYESPGADVDSLTVSVSDGEAAPVSVTVNNVPIDPAEAVVTATIPVSDSPAEVVVSPSGSSAYVIHGSGGLLSEIDTSTNTVDVDSLGFGPNAIAVSPDGTRTYIVGGSSDSVTVFDTSSGTPVATIAVGNGPSSVAVSPDGTRIYVTNRLDDTVSVIDTATNTVVGAPITVGDGPRSVAVDPDGTRAYVTNGNANTVSVIDTATNTVIGAPITVGMFPTELTVSPDGTRVYVANNFGVSVSVIDTTSNAVVATIPVDTNPSALAVSPDGTRVYVTNFGSNSVSVIDTTTNEVIATIPVGGNPFGLAVSPDGTQAYVANSGGNTISVITFANRAPVVISTPTVGAPDAVTGVVSGDLNVADNDTLTYTVTSAPTKGTVVVNPDGTFTYTPTQAARLIANQTPGEDFDSFTVEVGDGYYSPVSIALANVPISPAEAFVSTTIAVGNEPITMAVSPTGARAYVANAGVDTVSVVDTGSGAVVATVPVGDRPVAVAVTPNGSRVYVANLFSDTVSVIDPATNTVIATIAVGDGPRDIAIDPDGTRVYVTNLNSDSVTVIDTATNTVLTTIAVTNAGAGVAVAPDGARLYVVDYQNGDVEVIDTNTYAATSFFVDSAPIGIALSPDGSRAYVVRDTGHLAVVNTATNAVIATVALNTAFPSSAAVSQDGSLVYVNAPFDNAIKVIDTKTNTVIATIPVGVRPNDVVVSPDGTSIYVVNATDNTVSVITIDGVTPPIV